MTANPFAANGGFDWPRWWIPRSTELQLDERAFLWDPEGRFSTGVNPEARQLGDVTERVAVLLGEPGAGKTRSVFDYAGSRSDVTVITLPDEVSAQDLRERVDDALAATPGDVQLIFDGLDEAMIRAGQSDVSGTTPTRGPTRPTAPFNDSSLSSAIASATRRTARSRSSFGYFLGAGTGPLSRGIRASINPNAINLGRATKSFILSGNGFRVRPRVIR